MAIVFLFYVCIVVILSGFKDIRTFAENYKCPCSCLGNFVDCSRQGLIAVPKDLPIWVTRLEIQYNAISELKSEDFKGLKNLTHLDVSNNEIKSLNSSVFDHLTGLQHLKINHNKLTEFPQLKGLPSLTSVEANHNRITYVAQEFCLHTPQLKAIEMNNNYITDISPGVFPANNIIQKIILNNNRLETLESGCLDNLTKIETLKMNKNRIGSIPRKLFEKLTRLKTLEITKNRLTRLDGLSFQKLGQLQTLKLRKNSISFPLMDVAAFFGLKQLQTLQLDHNNITTISRTWLYDLHSLKELTLHHNKITTIEPKSWEDCPELIQLDLSHNRLRAITRDSFKKLTGTKLLFLKNNNIQNIEEGSFHDLINLTELELSNNELSWTIEDMNGTFNELRNLEKLSLENNKIKSIAKNAFSGLTRVTKLNLLNNAVSTIQSNAFETMIELSSLKFNSSNFLCDCKLAWLSQWLMAKKFEKFVVAKCHHPMDLQGRSIFSVEPELFKCDGNTLKPVITINPVTRKALKGDNITLTCEAVSTKDSDTQFSWKKDNVLLLKPVTVNQVNRDDSKIIRYSTKLHLHNLKDSDAGTYQCVISNSFGPAYSRKANIEVQVFPHFSKKPQDVTVKAGTTARLECSATGRPTPTIFWSKDGGGGDFPAARQRRLNVMPNDNVFFIVDVTDVDEGMYTCNATNEAGSITSNLNLTVLQTPSFVKPMEKEKKTQEDETTVIECMADGIPKPKVTWYKNGKPLETNQQRYFFTAANQLLIIVQTKAQDAGIYMCEMTNTLGTERGASKLAVYRGDKQISLNTKEGSSTSNPSDESTTTGIIIIAVVCCVVGTSLVWVIIIYQTRKRHEMYSATPTDETTLPGEVAGPGYQPYTDGSFTMNGPMTVQGYQYQDYQMKESGYESSSGQFRAQRAAIFPSDVDEEENGMTVPLTFEASHHDNSDSEIHYPNSETDSMKSSQSTSSTHTSGQQTLQTFRPILSNSNTFVNTTQTDSCENCERQRHSSSADNRSCHKQSIQNIPIPNGMPLHHGSLPQPPGDSNIKDSCCTFCNCDSEVSGCASQQPPPPPYSTCCNNTKVPSSPNGPHASVNNTPDNHETCYHSNTSPEKTPPAIPPKQHKHSHLHSNSNTCSLPNGTHVVMNGSALHGAVDV